MKIVVAICTWNRSGLLRQTLGELVSLRVPTSVGWEVIVVDNGSTDNTAEVIESFADRIPVRRLCEPRAGKSYAANTALSEARGDLLIWTDDDVLVPPDWLDQYVRAARKFPQASFFAGAIDPWFEIDPPAWICRHLFEISGVFAIAAYGKEPHRFGWGDGVFGANMAFRMEVAKAYPLNPHLGRIRGELPGGDDTDLVERVVRDGHVGFCIPAARVRHYVPSGRLNVAYVWKWYRGSGHAFVRRYGMPECCTIAGMPRWVLGKYLKARVKVALRSPLRDEAWLEALIEAARMEGILREVSASGGIAAAGAVTSGEPGAVPSSAAPTVP